MNFKLKRPGLIFKPITVLIGFCALLWFLIRVIPKPSRASYPCQRAAFPLATGFILWITGLISSSFLLKYAKYLLKKSMLLPAAALLILSIITAIIAINNTPDNPAFADSQANVPIGTARGIYPGRVVWVHDPNATQWQGYNSGDNYWYDCNHTDIETVEKMMSLAIRSIAGQTTEEKAWQEIFKFYNNNSGKGSVGYQAGEKIAIKLNLTTCAERNNSVSKITYSKTSMIDRIDNSPQMVLSLLRQLVNKAGVEPDKITVGDPTALLPNYLWNKLYPEFPEITYLDNYGSSGRTRSEFSNVAIYWSTSDADGKLADYIPRCFAQADYIINFSILKSHGAGITLCGKNHYGSILRCPDGYLRDQGYLNYYNMHNSLPFASGAEGFGQYRSLVDLMGHNQLGGKTILYMIDGLFSGDYWDSKPFKWSMTPFNDNWPNSLFVSLDPVAIDSVGYDFLVEQYTRVTNPNLQGGAEDYLHEAAMAERPASLTSYDPENDGTELESLGVHEHWNNPTDKQYSRNLGTDNGIELIKLPSISQADFNLDNKVNFMDFAHFAQSWQKNSPDENYNRVFDTAEPDGNIDHNDLSFLANQWLN